MAATVARRTLLLTAGAVPLLACTSQTPRPSDSVVDMLAGQGYVVSDPGTLPAEALADAITAFQKANRMDPTGVADSATVARIHAAPVRTARTKVGVLFEADLARGLLLRVDTGRVTHTLNVASPATGQGKDGERPVRLGLPYGTFRLRAQTGTRWVFLPPYALTGARSVRQVTAAVEGLVVPERELAALATKDLLRPGMALQVYA